MVDQFTIEKKKMIKFLARFGINILIELHENQNLGLEKCFVSY